MKTSSRHGRLVTSDAPPLIFKCLPSLSKGMPALNSRTRLRELEFAGAVAEFAFRRAHGVEHGEPEVGDRCAGRVQVASGLDGAAAFAEQDEREIVVVVAVAVAVAAAIGNERVVQDGTVALLDGV